VDVISLFMALLSSRGISTPSLQARGEQRRFFYFNNDRDIPYEQSDPRGGAGAGLSIPAVIGPPVGQGTRLWLRNTPSKRDETVCLQRSRLKIIPF